MYPDKLCVVEKKVSIDIKVNEYLSANVLIRKRSQLKQERDSSTSGHREYDFAIQVIDEMLYESGVR